MALDWQISIVAFAAISLQIMTSIKLMFGRSAVKKCNIWRETDRSPIEVFGHSTPEVVDKTQAPRGDTVPEHDASIYPHDFVREIRFGLI